MRLALRRGRWLDAVLSRGAGDIRANVVARLSGLSLLDMAVSRASTETLWSACNGEAAGLDTCSVYLGLTRVPKGPTSM